MTVIAEERSKLTDRYQTTVPRGVRNQLRLGKGDEIVYRTDAEGRVYIEPLRRGEADPALGAFLDLIEADIKAHPDRLRALDGALQARMADLVEDLEVDLEAPRSDADE
jgi:antitoxin PrlF